MRAFRDFSIDVRAIGQGKSLFFHRLQLERFPDLGRQQRVARSAVDKELELLGFAGGAGDGGVDVGEAHKKGTGMKGQGQG